MLRAPFGWYKSFQIRCLGHPLSEWSGRYAPGEEAPEAAPKPAAEARTHLGAHQPVEQLDALRAIPGLTVFRPADGVETAMAWAWIAERAAP